MLLSTLCRSYQDRLFYGKRKLLTIAKQLIFFPHWVRGLNCRPQRVGGECVNTVPPFYLKKHQNIRWTLKLTNWYHYVLLKVTDNCPNIWIGEDLTG